MRIVITGCGDIAGFMGLACRLNRKVTVPACVDINPERVQAFAKKFSIKKTYTDFDEMLSQSDAEAVYLAVPHFLHHSMIKKALAAGRSVFCEKPVTTEVKDALELRDIISSSSVKVGINYQYRYDRSCRSLIEACGKGLLGEILFIRVNIPWKRTASYFSASPWHSSLKESGGGTLLTQASHFIDIAMKAAGGRPSNAYGIISNRFFRTEVEDNGAGIIQMENGIPILVTSTMTASREKPPVIEACGTMGNAIYNGTLISGIKFTGIKKYRAVKPAPGIHPLFSCLEGFRRWVDEDKEFLVPLEDSIPVLAAVKALYASSVSGKREYISLPDFK